MRILKPQNEDEQNWLITYSDLITLVLCFFVMLYTTAEVKVSVWDELKAGFNAEMKKQQRPKDYLKQAVRELDSLRRTLPDSDAFVLQLNKEGLEINFVSKLLFPSAEAQLLPEGEQVLRQVAGLLGRLNDRPYEYEVQGHTDDLPINTPIFPSNWELSSARATTVVRALIASGLDPEKCRASGFAETRPELPNRDSKGVALPENQAANRRVVVLVRR
jgi:chemotaxis protein MotB